MLQKHISQYSEQELETLIQYLVTERCPESMTLEYKAEQYFDRRARLEIAKDISSFANTKGGIIIYGIPEERLADGAEEHAIPKSEYGIEPIPDFESRMENALTEFLSPHLPDLWIKRVTLSQRPGYVVYLLWHPESWLGPHMVQASNEQRFYRRGLKRTITMTEPEIREAYEKTQRLVGRAEQFLNSQDVNYISNFFPGLRSISQAVSCPHMLVMDRIDYSGTDMREWLRNNIYPQRTMSPDSSVITWYPSLHGVQAGMKGMGIAQRTMHYWIELHRNGAMNVLWQTPITSITPEGISLLDWRKERTILEEFVNFNKVLYEKIHYFGPLRLRFTINKLDFVELRPGECDKPFAAQLPNNTFSAELIEDTARLFDNPNMVVKPFVDRLFQSYGVWEAPHS